MNLEMLNALRGIYKDKDVSVKSKQEEYPVPQQINLSDIIIKEYLSQIEENIDSLLRKRKNTQIETKNQDGNTTYIATIKDTTQIKDDNDLVYDIEESTKISIPPSSKETIDKGLNKALARAAVIDMYQNKSVQPLTNEDVIMEKFREDYGKTPPCDVPSVQEYIALNKDRLLQQEKAKGNDCLRDVLMNNFVAPALMNYSLQKVFDKAQKESALKDSKILTEKDIGYCTKSLTATLYMLKAKYGKFAWLPDNAEDAAHPNTFMEHIKEEYINPQKGEQDKDIVSFLRENDNYKAGCIVMIALDNSGTPHYHAMMYSGKDKDGTPKFLGFNDDMKDFTFKRVKYGKIINIPAIIQNDFSNENAHVLQRQASINEGSFSEEKTISNASSSDKHFNVTLREKIKASRV